MKLLRNVTAATKAILLAGLLGACQNENENALTPQTSATAPDKNAKTAMSGLLIKNGEDIIEYAYNGLGRPILTKVTLPTKNKYVVYTYSIQQVAAQEYQISTGMKLANILYKLDGNGRCVEAAFSGYTHAYQYDADGQLIKMYNKQEPAQRIEFLYTYDQNTNSKSLSKMKSFDQTNKSLRDVQYDYSAPGYPSIPDLNPLNPEYMDGTTRYLPIFGKFNSNLPRVIFDNNYIAKTNINYVFDYSMNSDGLPKTVSRSNLGGGNLVITERKYSAPLAQ